MRLFVRGSVVLFLLALFTAAVPFQATAAPKAKKAKVQLKVLTKNQQVLLGANKLKVRVKSNRATVVQVKATAGGKKNLFRGQKIRFKRKGTKVVSLRLTTAGRKQLSKCGAKTVTVTGKPKAGKSKRTKKKLARWAKRCVKPLEYVEVPLGENPEQCDFLDPSICLQPFANDYFTKADPSTPTGRRLDIGAEATPVNSGNQTPAKVRHFDVTDINRADGFSPGNLITLKIPGLDTPAAFENSKLVPITDLKQYADPDQAVIVIDAETGERHPVWAELDSNPTTKDPDGTGPNGPGTRPENTGPVNLIIRPAGNFDYGKHYIVALRNLRDASNNPIESPIGFRVYRDDLPTRQPIVEDRRDHMESVISTLTSKAGVDRDSLYMAWDFTVASRDSVTGRATQIRDEAFAELGDTNLANRVIEGNSPEWTVTGVENNPEAGILRRVTGTIDDIPCFLDSVNCVTGGKFNINANGEVQRTPNSTVDAPFRCDIPSSTVDGSNVIPAQTGIYGHGLLGTLNQVRGQNQYANETNTIWCAMNFDGFADNDLGTVVAALGDLSNFNKLADRMQQGFLNFMFLQRAMIHPNGFSTSPDFQYDAGSGNESLIDVSAGMNTRGQYMGVSQGGIMGGALVALAPDLDRGVLDVPGMNYSTLLRRSVDSDEYFKLPVLGLYSNYPDEAERPLLLSLLQLLWDRGEANGYAGTIGTNAPLPNTPAHDVLLRVAVGDHQVANVTAEAFARTAGAKVYSPSVNPDRHWEATPFTGLDQVTSFPAPAGDSWFVYYDGGPVDYFNSTLDLPELQSECNRDNPAQNPCQGSGVAPIENLPPRTEWGYGADPHGYPRYAWDSINHGRTFLGDGTIGLCHSGSYCYANNWNGPEE